MRVAIDARTIVRPQTGDRTYMLNLLRHLPSVDGNIEYFVLVDRPLPPRIEALLDTKYLQVVVHTSPGGKLWTACALPRLARRLRADVVHLQYIAPLRLPCPYVCTVHDITFRLFPQWFDFKDRLLMNWLMPRSMRRAARVTVPSECTAHDIMTAYHIGRDKLAVIPYAAPPEFSVPPDEDAIGRTRARYGLNSDYFLFVGTLQPRKNLPRLLQAFARAKTGPVELVIAGKQGWRQPRLEDMIADLGLTRRVRLLGYVPDDDLPPLYAGALALLFPTLYEGFGLPVLEAMACGTPVLTSSVSALPEVAGTAALLVDPLSPADIARQIARLASDAELRRFLAEAGRQRAARFSWVQTASETVNAYQDTVR